MVILIIHISKIDSEQVEFSNINFPIVNLKISPFKTTHTHNILHFSDSI